MTTEIVFSHSGSMFAYYLGIAEILQKYDLSNVVFSGTSGGCFPCILLNAKRDIRDFFDQIIEHIKENDDKNWDSLVTSILRHCIDEEDVESNQDKFYCKFSRLNGGVLPEKVVVSNWTSKEDFVECIASACFIPMVSDNKMYKVYRNEKVMDGFFSGTSSKPVTDNPYVLFSPNKWRFSNPTWMFPTKDTEWLKAMYELGYNDALTNIKDIEAVLKPIKEKDIENHVEIQPSD
jgi:hypothetical protein